MIQLLVFFGDIIDEQAFIFIIVVMIDREIFRLLKFIFLNDLWQS